MNDPSGAVVWVDGPGSYGYAIVSVDGRVWNWSVKAWEAMPAAPTPAHIRPMAKRSFGPALWSQDVVPAVMPYPAELTALVFTLGANGMPSGFRVSTYLTYS